MNVQGLNRNGLRLLVPFCVKMKDTWHRLSLRIELSSDSEGPPPYTRKNENHRCLADIQTKPHNQKRSFGESGPIFPLSQGAILSSSTVGVT